MEWPNLSSTEGGRTNVLGRNAVDVVLTDTIRIRQIARLGKQGVINAVKSDILRANVENRETDRGNAAHGSGRKTKLTRCGRMKIGLKSFLIDRKRKICPRYRCLTVFDFIPFLFPLNL